MPRVQRSYRTGRVLSCGSMEAAAADRPDHSNFACYGPAHTCAWNETWPVCDVTASLKTTTEYDLLNFVTV